MANTDDILTLFVGPEEGEEDMAIPADTGKNPPATSAEDILKQIRDLVATYFGEAPVEEEEV